jgi:hypothetical protein
MAERAGTTIEEMNEEARVRLVSGLEGKGAHLSFEDAVRGFPEGLMNTKPPHVPYTFWHQLEHIRITQGDMIGYILDPDHVSPEWPAGYWPPQDEQTEGKGWQKTIRSYTADRGRFIELLRDSKRNLLARVKHLGNRSILRCTLIIIDHTAYHLGEFVMGRQILGAWESELA